LGLIMRIILGLLALLWGIAFLGLGGVMAWELAITAISNEVSDIRTTNLLLEAIVYFLSGFAGLGVLWFLNEIDR
jgi:hypothetical protein